MSIIHILQHRCAFVVCPCDCLLALARRKQQILAPGDGSIAEVGSTPLLGAAQAGHAEVARAPNSPLRFASKSGSIYVYEPLIWSRCCRLKKRTIRYHLYHQYCAVPWRPQVGLKKRRKSCFGMRFAADSSHGEEKHGEMVKSKYRLR